MRTRKNIIRYVMLIAGIILLFSVVIPHHHHSNDMPCFQVQTEHSHDTSSSHDCGCNGHKLALFTSLLSHVSSDVSPLLFPLQTLFDYFQPSIPLFRGQTFDRERAFYSESLHDAWIACSCGLRAPPVC